MSFQKLAVTIFSLGLLMTGCTDDGLAPDTAAPPITESETGRIVGQPIEVDAFRVDVGDAGTALFVVSGSIPSDCHEATFGFEEPNSVGVMIGEAESWLDPECVPQQEPSKFTESIEITALPPGEYLARLDGDHEASFVIPETPATASAVEETRSPSSFTPLGKPGCSPPAPFLPWPEESQPGELAEIRTTSSDIDVWGLLWRIPPLPVAEEIKMVWRVTGTGEFGIRATKGATDAELTSGPSLHQGSNFERPGEEWGTAFIFPSSGCWEIEITRGTDSAYVWIQVEG